MAKVELLGHMVVLAFLRNPVLFSVVAAPIYILINSAQGFPFLHIRDHICYFFCLFDDSHSDRYEVISCCDFDLPLSTN